MKIALLTSTLARVHPEGTGAEQQVVGALADALVARGHDVTLYASSDSVTTARLRGLPRPAILASLDELRARLALGELTQPMLLQLVSDLTLEHTAWSVRDACASGCDVIHTQGLHGALLLRDIAVPHVATIHGALPLDAAGSRRYLSTLLGETDDLSGATIVCVSASQRATWPDAASARVIHHGLDVARFPLGHGARGYLLHLGRLAWQKGTHLAIQLARQARLPLKLAGAKDGPLADPAYFARHVRPYLDGVEVEYVGEADHATRIALYQGAIALLAPLQWDEPFGLVLVEAMACGTPVLALRRGAAPELIRHGITGFLADDLETLARHLPAARDLSPVAIRAHVATEFTIARMVTAYEAAYVDAIDQSGSRAGNVPGR